MCPALGDRFFTRSGSEGWVKEEEAHSCSRKGKHQFFLGQCGPPDSHHNIPGKPDRNASLGGPTPDLLDQAMQVILMCAYV